MIISGIYQIVNKINNKSYIGSSEDIHKRWKRHNYDLKREKHHSVPLQRALDKYGFGNLLFNIVEEIPNADANILLLKEQEWINKIKPEYNIGAVGGGDNISQHPNLDEIKKKHSVNLKKRWLDPSFRARQMIRLSGSTNPNWRGGPTFCKCGNIIASHTLSCSKCVDKTGAKNPFYGKEHSPETRRNLSQKMKGRLPPNTLKVTINGTTYRSFSEAAIAFGVHTATIRNWLNGRKPRKNIISISLPHI